MIVLDTNILSELFRPAPNDRVLAWMDRQPGDLLFTTAVTRGELLFGVHCMPNGLRKETLLQGLMRILDHRFAGRILEYDRDAADTHALTAAAMRAQGRPMSYADAMIAGTVRSRGAALATRNVRDFEGCGIALIDPWH